MAKEHDKSQGEQGNGSNKSGTITGRIDESKNRLPDFQYTPPPPPKDNKSEK